MFASEFSTSIRNSKGLSRIVRNMVRHRLHPERCALLVAIDESSGDAKTSFTQNNCAVGVTQTKCCFSQTMTNLGDEISLRRGRLRDSHGFDVMLGGTGIFPPSSVAISDILQSDRLFPRILLFSRPLQDIG